MTDLTKRALEIAQAPHCYANEVVGAVIRELVDVLSAANARADAAEQWKSDMEGHIAHADAYHAAMMLQIERADAGVALGLERAAHWIESVPQVLPSRGEFASHIRAIAPMTAIQAAMLVPEVAARVADAREKIGQARLLIDTEFAQLGETVDYSPKTVKAFIYLMDDALATLPTGDANADPGN